MSIITKSSIFFLFITSLLFSSSFVKADDGSLPSEMFTAIMLKALSYDRNIDRLAKDKIVIGIVSPSDGGTDKDFGGQVKDNIDKVQSSFLLKGKPLADEVLSIDKTFDKAKFEGQLKQDNISVLIVSVNDPSAINNVLGASQELQISSVCANPGCAQNGVALEIIQNDSKPKMVSNLESIKREGSDYNSKFLAMCEASK